jgi:hypothetical protein
VKFNLASNVAGMVLSAVLAIVSHDAFFLGATVLFGVLFLMSVHDAKRQLARRAEVAKADAEIQAMLEAIFGPSKGNEDKK